MIKGGDISVKLSDLLARVVALDEEADDLAALRFSCCGGSSSSSSSSHSSSSSSSSTSSPAGSPTVYGIIEVDRDYVSGKTHIEARTDPWEEIFSESALVEGARYVTDGIYNVESESYPELSRFDIYAGRGSFGTSRVDLGDVSVPNVDGAYAYFRVYYTIWIKGTGDGSGYTFYPGYGTVHPADNAYVSDYIRGGMDISSIPIDGEYHELLFDSPLEFFLTKGIELFDVINLDVSCKVRVRRTTSGSAVGFRTSLDYGMSDVLYGEGASGSPDPSAPWNISAYRRHSYAHAGTATTSPALTSSSSSSSSSSSGLPSSSSSSSVSSSSSSSSSSTTPSLEDGYLLSGGSYIIDNGSKIKL